MKNNLVWMNLCLCDKAAVQIADELVFLNAARLVDVENQLIHLERIVVAFAQFELPGADMLGVVENVFELVEIHERPFDFIEPHLFHFRTAGDVADQSRRSPATMRTRSIDQTAINEIACAIT